MLWVPMILSVAVGVVGVVLGRGIMGLWVLLLVQCSSSLWFGGVGAEPHLSTHPAFPVLLAGLAEAGAVSAVGEACCQLRRLVQQQSLGLVLVLLHTALHTPAFPVFASWAGAVVGAARLFHQLQQCLLPLRGLPITCAVRVWDDSVRPLSGQCLPPWVWGTGAGVVFLSLL